MSWQLLRLARRCWFCPTVIESGDLARLGEHTPGVWCVACALRQLGETPPAEFRAPATPTPVPAPAAPAPQPTLFEASELTGQFKHIDARVALDRLRSALGQGGRS